MENQLQVPAEDHQGSMLQSSNIFNDAGLFSRIDAIADMMAKGKTSVPDHLKNQKGDCFAVCEQAYRWGISPWAVAPKTYFIKGVIAYEAQLVNAVIISSGVLASRPRYEYIGSWDAIIGKSTTHGSREEQGLGVTVFVTFKGESFERSYTAYLSECPTRNSPNWKFKQKLQLSYVAIRELTRQQAPDVMMGVYADDEIEDAPRNINQAPSASPRVVDISHGKSAIDAGDSEIVKKIKSCKTAAEVESFRSDITMMKGTQKAIAVDAFKARMAELTISGEVVSGKTFVEIEEQINATPSSALEFVSPELISHLPKDQQAAISKLANTVFDSTLK